ncbi:hypothetical protein [Pantoea sp. Ap-870]|uniref:hypothetical protein n=1 Tax=Pantoea sp. Ap-870 TaxID=2608358 RepID=UPI00353048C3
MSDHYVIEALLRPAVEFNTTLVPAVYQNLLVLPAALMLGMALAVLTSSFKKYL